MKTTLVVILFLVLLCSNILLGQERCPVTLKISGERADGNGTWESEFIAYKYCTDFTQEEKAKQDEDWAKHYGKKYTLVGSATKAIDCAGTTFQFLFAKGPYFMTAGVFTDAVITWFGKRIFGTPVSWGDVQPGDVLVYGDKHITYIESVNTTLGVVTSVVIRTKNGFEPVFLHEIGLLESVEDPLRRGFSREVQVYHVDITKINVEVISDCNCTPKGPGYQLKTLTLDPDKRLGSFTMGNKPVSITMTKDNVKVNINNGSFDLKVNSPPEFIGDNDIIKLNYTNSYTGNEDDVYLKLSYGTIRIDYTFDNWESGVGKISNTKFLRNTASGIITLTPQSGWDDIKIEPELNLSVGNSSIIFHIFEAVYERVK
jgi:hypothetical protein